MKKKILSLLFSNLRSSSFERLFGTRLPHKQIIIKDLIKYYPIF